MANDAQERNENRSRLSQRWVKTTCKINVFYNDTQTEAHNYLCRKLIGRFVIIDWDSVTSFSGRLPCILKSYMCGTGIRQYNVTLFMKILVLWLLVKSICQVWFHYSIFCSSLFCTLPIVQSSCHVWFTMASFVSIYTNKLLVAYQHYFVTHLGLTHTHVDGQWWRHEQKAHDITIKPSFTSFQDNSVIVKFKMKVWIINEEHLETRKQS